MRVSQRVIHQLELRTHCTAHWLIVAVRWLIVAVCLLVVAVCVHSGSCSSGEPDGCYEHSIELPKYVQRHNSLMSSSRISINSADLVRRAIYCHGCLLVVRACRAGDTLVCEEYGQFVRDMHAQAAFISGDGGEWRASVSKYGSTEPYLVLGAQCPVFRRQVSGWCSWI